jgi:hypothetical protein
MKRIFLLLISVAFSTAVFAQSQNATPMLCPEPQVHHVSLTKYVPLEKVSIVCPDATAVTWAESHLKEWYDKFAPQVVSASGNTASMANEEYHLYVDKKGVKVEANTLQGVRYALYTLRQMTIAKRGTAVVEGWITPISTIEDKPEMDWRGMHICWFRENEPWEIERLIRLAAYYKLNHVVLESWGTFRSEVAPWWGWEDGKMTIAEVKRLTAIAKDLGVTLIPQMNIFGHAANARAHGGKHATLDLKSQYQPYFEPMAGWNWCLSNPNTVELQKKLIKELYEAFDCPGYFHIGCDEANVPTCPDCIKKGYSTLFANHVKDISNYLSKEFGARTLMWHDMFIQKGDPQWKGLSAFGTPETISVIHKLPKDIIICDWYYHKPRKEYPSLRYFNELGFDVLACPWNHTSGTKALINHSHELGIKGVLGTLWNYFYGTTLRSSYYHVSTLSWNRQSALKVFDSSYFIMFMFHTHLRHIDWDMKNTDPYRSGTYRFEVAPASTM